MSEAQEDRIVDKLISKLASKGLVVVTAALADDALRIRKAKDRLMRRSKLTPYEVSKFKLLPGAPSLTTVKNMIADGRILKDEVFTDKNNKQYVTRECINRLNVDV